MIGGCKSGIIEKPQGPLFRYQVQISDGATDQIRARSDMNDWKWI